MLVEKVKTNAAGFHNLHYSLKPPQTLYLCALK